MFTTEEKPLLQALPAAPFEISTWSYKRKVNANAHVVWAKNFYSVPFSHIGALVDLRVTETMLEVYRRDERLASHLLLPVTTTNQYRTNDADLPEGRSFQAWDRARIEEWAARIGSATVTVTAKIFETVFIDEAGFDAALAVLKLSRRFPPARVEAACALALRGRSAPRATRICGRSSTPGKTKPDKFRNWNRTMAVMFVAALTTPEGTVERAGRGD
ncbi:hypothetical protein E3O19_12020 [Cryobacterium algoritolerans]|uniref:Transposase for insertion sequence element IS21-like C-terminal domain-containing protein n=1 Tax=Cryobacterium algoritolerans TaxID=1259184 RepID=A0A4R8WRK7_9MICO|nr:hypothetical protein [Cryobacterium algoritolerans]TFC13814.1 hypothetical protein E3O19_12020 [Cryobacterium algoritolerans]